MPRNVSVTLSANVAGFIANTKRAADSVSNLGAKTQGVVAKNDQAINRLSTGAGALGAAAALGFGVAVKKAADFDAAMSSVAASGADARRSLNDLREAALQAGADTAFSATEAAGGIESLAKAGVSARDTLGGGLKGALDLAAAGQLSVGDAADSAASAMNQFSLAGRDVPHIADLLAQGAGTASGEVSDMAAALKQSGVVANQFGLSIDDTVQSLSLFAKGGLLGSDAGTAFKTMLTSLYAPAGAGAKALDRLGVSAVDAAGNLKDYQPLVDEVKRALDGLSEGDRTKAMRDIFGSDAIRAGTILLRDGSAGLQQVARDFANYGSAADVARIKTDNLKGDLERLGGSFDTLLINMGSDAQGPLRSVVQYADNAVQAIDQLPGSAKSGVLAVAGLGSGALLGVAGLGKLAVGAQEALAALRSFRISARTAGLAAGGIGAGITVAGLALGSWAAKQAEAKQRTDDLTEALLQSKGAIDANIAAMRAKSLEDSGALKAAQTLGIAIPDLTQASLGNAAAQARVNAQMAIARREGQSSIVTAGQAGQAQNLYAVQLETVSEAIGTGNSELARSVTAYKRQAESQKAATAAIAPAKTAVDSMTDSTQTQTASIDELIAATYRHSNALLSMSGGEIGMEAAIDNASAALKRNKENLDVNTAGGRANREALNGIASATQAYATELVKGGARQNEINAAVERGRGKFIKTAEAMGMGDNQAKKLADALFQIPKSVAPKIETPSDGALRRAKLTKEQFDRLPKRVKSEILALYNDGKRAEAERLLKRTAREYKARLKTEVSGLGAVYEMRDAIATVKGKTVKVTIRRNTINSGDEEGATGGLFTAAGFVMRGPRFSNGGRVWGAGTATSDSIDAKLSNGEFVHQTKSVNYYGADVHAAMNRRQIPREAFEPYGFATGGLVGNVDPAIARLMTAIQNPLGAIAAALTASNVANARVVAPRARLQRATAAYTGAVERRDDMKERIIGLQKQAAATKGVTKADRDLAAARRALARQNVVVSRTSREKTAATAAYNAVAGPAKDATDRLTEAQKALADSSRQMSEQFYNAYRSGSTDAKDWLDLMQTGATDIAAFTAKIQQLRTGGLNETLIQQIVGMGATAGSEIAQQIALGGRGLVDQLNKANASLQTAADALGYKAASGTGRYALGGPVRGPGTGTSDSIWGRLSNGEWVVPAAAVPANRPALERMTYGRTVRERPRFAPAYAGGGYVNTSAAAVAHGDQIAAAVREGLRGMTLHATLDGKPFHAMITERNSAQGRLLAGSH